MLSGGGDGVSRADKMTALRKNLMRVKESSPLRPRPAGPPKEGGSPRAGGSKLRDVLNDSATHIGSPRSRLRELEPEPEPDGLVKNLSAQSSPAQLEGRRASTAYFLLLAVF